MHIQQTARRILAAGDHRIVAHGAGKSRRMVELGADDVIVAVFVIGDVERQQTGAHAPQGCPRREYDVIRSPAGDSAHQRRKPIDLLQSALSLDFVIIYYRNYDYKLRLCV